MSELMTEKYTLAELRVVPTPTATDGALPPSHSEVRKIAETVLGGLKYSFAAVAADPDADTLAGTVEHEIKAALSTIPADRRLKYAEIATELVSAPPRARAAVFGAAAEQDAATYLKAGGLGVLSENVRLPELDAKLFGLKSETIRVPLDRLTTRRDALVVDGDVVPDAEALERGVRASLVSAEASGVHDTERISQIWGTRVEGDPFAGGMVDGEFEPFAPTDKLGLWVSQVRCVDETNPEYWGSDEIALAGVEVDENGDTRAIGETYIGGGFDDGDTKSYGNWRYTWFDLNEGQHWPKRYSVSFILAEKDHGGLQAFLDKIWKQVRDQVKAAIAKAVAGAVTPYLGPIIGQAIGQAVAWVVDVFVGWIISLFGDDLFPLQTVSVSTPSKSARWYYPNGTWGNPSSGTRVANFYGHGGHYQVRYNWQFHA